MLSLDPDLKEDLVGIIEKLLADKTIVILFIIRLFFNIYFKITN